jgi:hypothetical protein
MSDLWDAASAHDIARVKELLSGGADIREADVMHLAYLLPIMPHSKVIMLWYT